MAFRPSRRRKKPSYILDLNLAPLLSLFVALIPMLLITAIFQKVGIVNLFLPTLEEALLENTASDPAHDFTLAVTVTTKEISLVQDQKVLMTQNIENGLELDSLVLKLADLKDQYPDKRDAILLLDGSIRYETIIDIMDAVRINGEKELFPEISLADRILMEN